MTKNCLTKDELKNVIERALGDGAVAVDIIDDLPRRRFEYKSVQDALDAWFMPGKELQNVKGG